MTKNEQLKQADLYKEQMANLKLSQEQKEIFFKQEAVQDIYSSCCMDNQIVSKEEIEKKIDQAIHKQIKREEDRSYIAGYAVAYDYIKEMAEKRTFEITEEMVKKVAAYLDEANQTGYRTDKIKPLETHTPPAPEELDHFMGHFIGQMQMSKKMFHPIEFAALVHKRIMDIRPFKEKNREIAMLITNFIFQSEGYPMIWIPDEMKQRYEDILKKAQHPSSPQIDDWLSFIAERVVASSQRYIK